MEVVTDMLVPGRGHSIGPDGGLALSASSIARVETAASYYHDNADVFEAQDGLILCEGGWAQGAAGIPEPPPERREGRLMYELARELEVPVRFLAAGIQSRTTMENLLHAARVFRGAGRLAIVTQLSQADRLRYCEGKAMPERKAVIIEAAGEDDPAIIADERRLLRLSHIVYGWALGPRSLHVADRVGLLAGRLVGMRPAARYT